MVFNGAVSGSDYALRFKMVCYSHNIKEFCVICYRRGKNYCIFVSLVEILKQNEIDKWAFRMAICLSWTQRFRMAICLSWTQRFACPGEIAASVRHLENAGRGGED